MATMVEYRINNVLQDYVPTLPQSAANIEFKGVAQIGYPDLIETDRDYYKYWTLTRTEQQCTDDYELWAVNNHAITSNGDPLVDDDGAYIVGFPK